MFKLKRKMSLLILKIANLEIYMLPLIQIEVEKTWLGKLEFACEVLQNVFYFLFVLFLFLSTILYEFRICVIWGTFTNGN